MKRYKKFVYEDERGITFKVNAKKGIILEASEGTSGELIIKALNSISNNVISNNVISNNALSKLATVSAGEYAEVISVYTDNEGNQAVVPPGWTVSGVSKENTIWGKDVSVVIYCIPKERVCGIDWTNSGEVKTLQRTYDQFVWTPVNLLKANGTLDSASYNEKFGRRNFRNNKLFGGIQYDEPFTGKLVLQKESVDKYGGYYTTRYDVSKDEETGKPRSIRGAYPWTYIDSYDARKVASTMVESKTVTSHLMYGAEYDTREEWVIETKTKTFYEIANDSTEWGNYWNTEGSPKGEVITGSCKEWSANNIDDFAGNVIELTQEQHHGTSYYSVIRGGEYGEYGNNSPAHNRDFVKSDTEQFGLGFRATLYIK